MDIANETATAATLYVELAKTGLLGALIVVFVVWVRHLQDRLLEVVEKNTSAWVEVKATLRECQAVHNAARGKQS